jgi:N-acetylmuramoyl-L-alanine amidase
LVLLFQILPLVFSGFFPTALRADGELKRARIARDAFFADAAPKKLSDWRSLIVRFEEAANAQVKDTWRATAKLEAAELSLQAFQKFKDPKDAAKAETLTRHITKNCGRCPQAPKALILLGRALNARNKPDDAYRELMKVELNHPDAAETEEARVLMSALRAGATPPPIPTPVPRTLALGTTPTSSGAPAQTSPATKPEAKAPETKTASLPRTPPVKAPKPRSDGLAQVYAVTLEDFGDHSAVIAWTDKVTAYVYNLIPPGRAGGFHRVYVDMRDARLAPGIAATLKKTTPLVKLVKVNQFEAKTARLVMDFPEAHPYSPTFLDNPPRMVVFVAEDHRSLPEPPGPEAPPDPGMTPGPPPETGRAIREAPATTAAARGPAESLARQLGLKIRKVVIDPGHGGKDAGATGHGLREKDLALKAALMLKSKLEKRLKLEVVLTRDSDKFVTLDGRPKIARDNQGDLFISVHANANTLASVEGLETYLLNFSSDPSAQTVAARENASSDKSMSEMAGILELIAKNTRVSESRVLAKAIHAGALSSLRTKYKVRDLGVKEAVFVVLANVKVPAVLMEMGFLSNKNEAARLAEDQYLELLTDGVANGLENYLNGLPR